MKTLKVFPLLIIFTAVLSFYIYSLSIQNQGYYWDAAVYLGLAKNIFVNHVYGINFFHPEQLQQDYQYLAVFDESFRPPLFPFLLSFLVPFGQLVERSLSVIFYFLGVIVTFLFARKLFNEKIGIVSAIFVATSALFLFFTSKVLTESLFLLLFTSSLYAFYKSFEDERFFLLTGLLTALTILTHYPGGILLIIYTVFIALTRSKKEIRKIVASKYFLGAIVVLFLTLSPWLYFSYLRYGSPVGALRVAFGDVSTNYFQEPWYFFLQNIFSVFGLPIIFIIPGILAFRKFGDEWKLVALSSLIVFVVFSALGRKEFRYLVPFGSVFYVLCGVGFYNLEKSLNRKFFMLVPIVFALASLWSGITLIQSDYQAGADVKNAAYFLQQFPDNYVMAENYPVVNLVSGKQVLPFPWTTSGFNSMVANFSIHYIVIDQAEIYQSPPYVATLNETYPTIARFGSQISILKIS